MVADSNAPLPDKLGRDSAPHELEAAAAALVNSGVLPREDTGRIVAGSGENRACCLCAEVIGPADVEYEMNTGNASSFRFHIPCYFAWKRAAGSADGGGGHR